MNTNHLEEFIANPPSSPGAIFNDETQFQHNFLNDDLTGGGLLAGPTDCEMTDVWLSMEQAFENDISAMLPNTDGQLSEQDLIVSDLIDSASSLQELSQTIKTEPLDFDDCSSGLDSDLAYNDIKIEVDDRITLDRSIEKALNLNFPVHTHITSSIVNTGLTVTATSRPILKTKEEQDKKIFFCQQCGKKFSSLPDLKCHKMLCYGSNASDGSRPYKCDKCGCSYTRKYHLDTHKDRYHSNTSYSCGKCLKVYRAREDYLRHLRKNNCTPSRMKASKTNQELIMNSQRLNNVHRFPCRHCPKRFFRRHYLERHIEEKHHKDWAEQETCEICTPSQPTSSASSPSTDISITPVESDVSSDDSGLIIDHISGKLSGSIKAGQRFRLTSSNNNTLINVISHGDDIVGNGLYIKPDNSLYQCVMCDYTTKNITQLSRHLEKHQATKTTVTATPKASINIVAV